MRGSNIIVAFNNKKTINTVSNMLRLGGISVAVECSSAAELRKQLSYLDNGILICGYSLKGETIVSLIDDIPDSFSIILIGNYSQIDLCESERVFKLAVPLSKTDLVYSVMMLINTQNKEKSKPKPDREDKEKIIISQAKELLINKYHMSEEQAYRYMQKKSMNTGIKLSEIATIILH